MPERATNIPLPITIQSLSKHISRRTFVSGLLGIMSLSVLGCNAPWQQQPIMRPSLDFITYYNKPDSYHQEQVNTLPKRGYRITSLSVYGEPANALYAAMWIKRTGSAWQAFHGLNAAQYQRTLDTWTKRGYRPIILTATGSGSNVLFAVVFEQDSTPFMVKHNLTTNFDNDLINLPPETQPTTVQYWNTWATNNNYILRWGTIYGSTAHPQYAGIWEKNTASVAWNWESGYYDTSIEYQNRLQAETMQWTRPAFITLSADSHCWSVFRDDQIGSCIARNGLTSSEYETQLNHFTKQGYYPLTLQANGSGNDIRFATIFVKNENSTSRKWTVTGQAVPSLSTFDTIMQKYLQDNGIRAGSLAIARDGRLVFARAYTWAEPEYPITQPTSLFRIASCQKPLTSIAIHQLLEKGSLSLDTNLQHILQLQTPEGGPPVDPRFNKVLLWHLLSHRGGWNAFTSFDPMSHDATIAKSLHTQLPVNKYQIASYMTTQQLQFDPGTQEVYSPFGYSLLGQMLEKVTNLSYVQATTASIFTPLGLTRPRPARSLLQNRASSEVRYHGQAPYVEPSVVTSDQSLVPFDYGGLNIENRDSTGGRIMAPADYVKILAAFDLEEANPLLQPATVRIMWSTPSGVSNGSMLRGWFKDTLKNGLTAIGHTGGFPGATSYVFRRSDNLSFAVFVNSDPLAQPYSLSEALNAAADAVTTWPNIDLFSSVGIPPFNR